MLYFKYQLLFLSTNYHCRITSVFLAGKVEESYVKPQEILKLYPMFTLDQIMQTEIQLIEVKIWILFC